MWLIYELGWLRYNNDEIQMSEMMKLEPEDLAEFKLSFELRDDVITFDLSANKIDANSLLYTMVKETYALGLEEGKKEIRDGIKYLLMVDEGSLNEKSY